MFTRKVLVSALLSVGTLAAVVTPLTSVAQIDVFVNTAPPAVRYEAVPAPRDGYVWSNGYWNYNGTQHVWTPGDWQASRPGYTYSQPRWVESDGRYRYQASRWDRDGDGVPNRSDRAPNDPSRR
jgi:hypothetical protein